LSEIYPTQSKGGGSGVKSTKHTTKESIYDIDGACDGKNWDSLKSRHFDEGSVDVKSIKKGVYVHIDRFMVMAGHKERNPVAYAKKIKSVLTALGSSIPKVYAFKSKALHKVENKKNWTNLEDFVINSVKTKFGDSLYKKLAERNLVRSLADGHTYSRRHRNSYGNFHGRDKDTVARIVENGDRWYKFIDLFTKDSRKLKDAGITEQSLVNELEAWITEKSHKKEAKKLDNLLDACGSYLDSGTEKEKIDNNKDVFEELNSIIKKLEDRYPLVRHFEEDNFQSWRKTSDDFCIQAVNYINIIDATCAVKKKVKKNLTSK